MPHEPSARPFSAADDGVVLHVRLTPRASRDGLDGVALGPDGRAYLKLRVAAPPVEGAANAALIAFLAQELGLRKADIAILSGEGARMKRLMLAGDAADLLARLTAWAFKTRG